MKLKTKTTLTVVFATVLMLIGVAFIGHTIENAVKKYENLPEVKLRKQVELLELKQQKKMLMKEAQNE